MDDATNGASASDDVPQTPSMGTTVRAHLASGLTATVRHIAQIIWVQAAVALVLAALLVPAASFLAAGIWASVTYVSTARALIALVERYDLTTAFARLSMLDAALRVGMASAGYFAVLCSTTALAAGILGRGRTRTFLPIGLVLLIPSAVAFSFGARLSADVVGPRFGISAPLLSALFMYALFDAVLLGTLTVDTRTRRRRVRGRRLRQVRHDGESTPPATTVQVTPMVRFGPAQPVTTPLAQDILNEPAPAQLRPASDPPQGDGEPEVPAQNVAGSEDAEAHPLAGVGAQTPPGA